MSQSRLTSVFVRAMAWNYVSGIVLLLAQLAYTAVTARHIPARDFGAYAVGLTLLQVLNYFGGSTFGNAVMRAPELGPQVATTAMLLSVAAGSVISLVLVVLAEPAETLLHAPGLTQVLYLLALMPPMTGVSAVASGLLRREDRYRSAAVIALISSIIGFLVGGFLAVQGEGVVALVLAQVVCAWFGGVVATFAVRRRLSRSLSARGVRQLLPFSAQVSGQNLLHYVVEALPVWVVTRSYGVTVTGYFTRSMQLVYLPTYQLLTAIQRSLYPLYQRLREPGRRRAALTDVLVLTSGGAAVFYGIGAACGEPLALLLLGPAWSESARLVPAFCAAYAASTVYGVTSSAAEALGWMSVIWRVQVMFILTTVVGLVIAAGHDVSAVVLVMFLAPASAHALMVSTRTFRESIDGARVATAYAVHGAIAVSLYAAASLAATIAAPSSHILDLAVRIGTVGCVLAVIWLLRAHVPAWVVAQRRWRGRVAGTATISGSEPDPAMAG